MLMGEGHGLFVIWARAGVCACEGRVCVGERGGERGCLWVCQMSSQREQAPAHLQGRAGTMCCMCEGRGCWYVCVCVCVCVCICVYVCVVCVRATVRLLSGVPPTCAAPAPPAPSQAATASPPAAWKRTSKRRVR